MTPLSALHAFLCVNPVSRSMRAAFTGRAWLVTIYDAAQPIADGTAPELDEAMAAAERVIVERERNQASLFAERHEELRRRERRAARVLRLTRETEPAPAVCDFHGYHEPCPVCAEEDGEKHDAGCGCDECEPEPALPYDADADAAEYARCAREGAGW